eukprot:364031-Chlamydomonas_euryale.AAC.1
MTAALFSAVCTNILLFALFRSFPFAFFPCPSIFLPLPSFPSVFLPIPPFPSVFLLFPPFPLSAPQHPPVRSLFPPFPPFSLLSPPFPPFLLPRQHPVLLLVSLPPASFLLAPHLSAASHTSHARCKTKHGRAGQGARQRAEQRVWKPGHTAHTRHVLQTSPTHTKHLAVTRDDRHALWTGRTH